MITAQHGTYSRYQNQECRCALCKKACREYHRALRARLRAERRCPLCGKDVSESRFKICKNCRLSGAEREQARRDRKVLETQARLYNWMLADGGNWESV